MADIRETSERILRPVIAAISAGIATASWGFHLYLWFHFVAVQPRTPQPAKGLTHVMNNHGWYFYLSAAQDTQLRLLVYISLGTFILAAISFGAPKKRQWELYATPISAPLKYFLGSVLLWSVTLWHWSYCWSSILVSKGFILSGN
jgi:hypothetical protein